MIPQVTLLEDIADWRTDCNILCDSINDLELLETSTKATLVSSINEVKDSFNVLVIATDGIIVEGEALKDDAENILARSTELAASVPCDFDDLVDHGNAGTSLTIDCCAHDTHVFNCDQSTLTLSFSNFISGRTIKLVISNGLSCTITYPVNVKFIGGTAPTLSSNQTRLVVQKLTTDIHVFIEGTNFV